MPCAMCDLVLWRVAPLPAALGTWVRGETAVPAALGTWVRGETALPAALGTWVRGETALPAVPGYGEKRPCLLHWVPGYGEKRPCLLLGTGRNGPACRTRVRGETWVRGETALPAVPGYGEKRPCLPYPGTGRNGPACRTRVRGETVLPPRPPTQPAAHSEHRFPAPSSKGRKDVVKQCLQLELAGVALPVLINVVCLWGMWLWPACGTRDCTANPADGRSLMDHGASPSRGKPAETERCHVLPPETLHYKPTQGSWWGWHFLSLPAGFCVSPL